MKNKCLVILTKAISWPMVDDCDYIGVDRGAFLLAQQKQPMVLAVGDFDSVSEEEFACIEDYAENVVHLNTMKNDSDFEAALRLIFEQGYQKAYVYGGLGNRLDHELVNERLCFQYKEKLVLINDTNEIQAYGEGVHQIKKKDFKYCSFFARSKAMITLKGMKYPLDHCPLEYDSLFTLSNEIIDDVGILDVVQGEVLAFLTKDE